MISRLVFSRLMKEVGELTRNNVDVSSSCMMSSIGCVRNSNQDKLASFRLSYNNESESEILYLLSDGMGGMKEGGVAASLAISSFVEDFYSSYGKDEVNSRISSAISYSNAKVYERLNGEGGATLSVIVHSSSEKAYYANVGDSRIYSASKDSGLTQLSQDDDVKSFLEREGIVVNEELINRNGLSRFIGMPDELVIQPEEFSPSGCYFMATDGCYRIGNKLLSVLYRYSKSQEDFCERAMLNSLWFGGVDNSSCLAIDFSKIYNPVLETPSEQSEIEMWDCFGSSIISVSHAELEPSGDEKRKPRRRKRINPKLLERRVKVIEGIENRELDFGFESVDSDKGTIDD